MKFLPVAGNFRGSMTSYYFVIKYSWLLMMDLRIMPVMEIIRHKTFVVVQKQRNPQKFPATKVLWYMVFKGQNIYGFLSYQYFSANFLMQGQGMRNF